VFSKLPLTALRTFEAAARSASFKSAADELAVTPAAVSHQIKALEAWLGTLLFTRSGKGVQLTAEGERLYHDAHAALLDISRSLEALRPRADSHTLILTTTPALAASWLIPRLGDFYRQWPSFNVRVETANEVVELLRDSSIDLAIRTVSREDPALLHRPLMSEDFAAYAAPGQADPAAVERLELIDLRWEIPGGFALDWLTWCAAAGHGDWLSRAVLRHYEDEHFALNAAIAGQGLVLASSVLVADSLAKGVLVPYRPEVRLPGPRYFAVCVPGRERQSPVREFLTWLEQQATSAD
jgi:DNA-binding transcriptional LysR family regulator